MKNLEFNDYQEGKYKYIGTFSEGLALVRDRKGLYGYINKKGKEVIPCKYSDAVDFSEGLAIVSNAEGLKGYIDLEGKEVIPCEYTDTTQFEEGLASVEISKGNYIYIDKTGNKSIPGLYSYAGGFGEGYAVIKMPGSEKYYYIDKNGKIYEMNMRTGSAFRNGIAIIQKDKELCIIDKKFQTIDSKKICNENNYYLCENGIIRIGYREGTYRYYDQTFKHQIPGTYSKASIFREGYAIVELASECIGILKRDGNIKLFSKEKYLEIQDFSEGLAAVKNSQGLWGYINTEGQEVIPCQYKAADPFSEGLAGVLDNENNLYYISKKGQKKITFDTVYYSSLELQDKTIGIKADSQQELTTKKLKVLGIVKEEMLKEIDQLAYTESSGLYKPQTRRRTNKKGNTKPEN